VPNTRINKDTDLPPRHLAPLERRELRRERARVATRRQWPIFLIVIAAGAVAFFAFDVPVGYILIAGLLILAAHWYIRYQSSSPRRRREMSQIMISEEDALENEKLAKEMKALSDDGFDGYAITLGKFLQHKRSIEAALTSRPGDSPQEKQVGQLVDSICFGVAEQFQSVAGIEKRIALLQDSHGSDEYETLSDDRRELLCQVIDAYKTLKQTRHDLPFILDPSSESSVKKPDVDLAGLVDQLQAEEEIARSTRARMRRDSI